jgi:hypothetical protein
MSLLGGVALQGILVLDCFADARNDEGSACRLRFGKSASRGGLPPPALRVSLTGRSAASGLTSRFVGGGLRVGLSSPARRGQPHESALGSGSAGRPYKASSRWIASLALAMTVSPDDSPARSSGRLIAAYRRRHPLRWIATPLARLAMTVSQDCLPALPPSLTSQPTRLDDS